MEHPAGFPPSLLLVGLLMAPAPVLAGAGGEGKATVRVECTRSASLINIIVRHERRIGQVKILVCDAKGDVFYIEVGKAMTGEVVRRIDKLGFTKGGMIPTVGTRDFHITQRIVVE